MYSMAQDWERSAGSDVERKDVLPRLSTSLFRGQGDEKGPIRKTKGRLIGKQRMQRAILVSEISRKVNTVNIF